MYMEYPIDNLSWMSNEKNRHWNKLKRLHSRDKANDVEGNRKDLDYDILVFDETKVLLDLW